MPPPQPALYHHRRFADWPARLVGDAGRAAAPPASVFGCVSWCAPTPVPAARVVADTCVVYMHGFPDTSVDARVRALRGGDGGVDDILRRVPSFCSRMPQKLEKELVLGACGYPAVACTTTLAGAGAGDHQAVPPPALVARDPAVEGIPGGESAPVHHAPTAILAVNFSGTPGSDATVPFERKTVSQEVADVVSLVLQLSAGVEVDADATTGGDGAGDAGRDRRGPFTVVARNIHLVGLSTGAIIGAVLRRELRSVPAHGVRSITVIAACGALGMEAALAYDFSPEQLGAFDDEATGFRCAKEFWVPEEVSLRADAPPEKYRATTFPLGRGYRDDFLRLDVRGCLAAPDGLPLLVLHGAEDRAIPLAEGRAVAAAAAPPADFKEIPKGNHLLSSDKPMKAALRHIRGWITSHTPS